MHIEQKQALAESLVEKGVLNKFTSNINMSLSILGYSSSEVFKRQSALPTIQTYSPAEDDVELSRFCQDLNRCLAQRCAAAELLISTPYHLLQHGEVNLHLEKARKYNELRERLAFMSRKEIFETLQTKDKSATRAVGKLVRADKLIELKVGSISEPLYPTFQLDEYVVVYPTVPLVLQTIKENGMSVLDFCLWIADDEGFVASARKVSRKYYKMPFKIFSDESDTVKLLEVLFSKDLIDEL